MDPRIGIVGLGLMGTEHAKRLDRAGATVVAGADVSQSARDQFADSFDAEVYPDHAGLLGADVDAVVVTVPNAIHEEVAVPALNAGCDVYLEKPVAHDLDSAERIAAAARGADGFCVTGFTMRHYPPVTELLDRVAAGEFGRVSHVEARYLRRDGIPDTGWFVDPELAGGGALLDVGVHVLDLALAVLGFPTVEGVFGRTWTGRESLDVEDSASALVRCADGKTISHEVSWAAGAGSGRSIIVRGSDGGARYDVDDSTLEVIGESDENGDSVTVDTQDHDWLTPIVGRFVDAVDKGEPPSRCRIDEGLAVQRIVDGIYRSDETGAVVDPS